MERAPTYGSISFLATLVCFGVSVLSNGPITNAMKAMGSGVNLLYTIANNIIFPFSFVWLVNAAGVAFCWLSSSQGRDYMRDREGLLAQISCLFIVLRISLWATCLLLLTLSYFLFACVILAKVLKGLCKSGQAAGSALSSFTDLVLGGSNDFFGATVLAEYCDVTKRAAGTTFTLFICSCVMLLANVMMLSATSAGKARLNAAFEEKPLYGAADPPADF
eukprot:TRINITY_DN81415_c0_g1_i1.p1 TRINITY_DN81415_c0_g1~~TRINITY_DN81415_c0_g1_i1.p1  ORF type:complete len:220 (+),score=23.07 TRINITY_DN81415_c0_g1_i1:62-721(+)